MAEILFFFDIRMTAIDFSRVILSINNTSPTHFIPVWLILTWYCEEKVKGSINSDGWLQLL